MFKHPWCLTLTLLAIVASFCGALRAQQGGPAPVGDQIQSFDSDITVNTDSTLRVGETITVLSTGQPFKRGIYRDFPTRYSDRFGNPYLIHLEVIALTRDGQPTEYHLSKLPNGLRIHLAGSGETLPPGPHTFELNYTVDRELGFFEDHDELYWNVTGNGWIFPIQTVSATVHLPKGIVQEAIIPDAYTGRQGSVSSDFTASADNQSDAMFRTTRVLDPHEGLTIVVRWPKGFVSPPTDEQKHQYFMEDNQALITGMVGVVLTLVYYLVIWFVVKRKASGGKIAPQPAPPLGFSPAALRYVWRRTFDRKAVIANLVDLAVKKQLAILQDVSGGFILGRIKAELPPSGGPAATGLGPAETVTPDEKLMLDRLFSAGDTIRLEPAHRAIVGGMVEALRQRLRFDRERSYFLKTGPYLLPGLAISIAAVVRSGRLIQGADSFLVPFLAVWLLLWSLAGAGIGSLAIDSWGNALSSPHHPAVARQRALIITAAGLGFIAVEVFGLVAMAWAASTGLAIVLMLLMVMNCAFHFLLKSPSLTGRALMDQIEGFHEFLMANEPARRGARPSTQNSPLLLEKYLPYAIALNVEKVWSEKFAAVLAQTTAGQPSDYSPAWYSGPAWDRIVPADFATSLSNSFSTAISASSTATRSSSSRSGTAGGSGEGR